MTTKVAHLVVIVVVVVVLWGRISRQMFFVIPPGPKLRNNQRILFVHSDQLLFENLPWNLNNAFHVLVKLVIQAGQSLFDVARRNIFDEIRIEAQEFFRSFVHTVNTGDSVKDLFDHLGCSFSSTRTNEIVEYRAHDRGAIISGVLGPQIHNGMTSTSNVTHEIDESSMIFERKSESIDIIAKGYGSFGYLHRFTGIMERRLGFGFVVEIDAIVILLKQKCFHGIFPLSLLEL